MDKVKKFLEQYVEWVAVGLGGAFVLYTLWAFVLNKPVKSTVGQNQEVAPADVAPTIVKEVVDPLDSKMKSSVKPATVDMPDYIGTEKKLFTPEELVAVGSSPFKLPVPLDQTTVVQKVAGPVAANPVTALPQPPPIAAAVFSQGSSNLAIITPPDANGQPGQAAPVANSVAPNQDVHWISVGGWLRTAKLADQFKKCNIPDVDLATVVLRVTLKRQERDAAGNWGPWTIVPPPAGATGVALMPMPATGDTGTEPAYLDFAEKNAPVIMRPTFEQVLHGDVWFTPGAKNPNIVEAQIVDVPFDPAAVKSGDKLTKEQQDIYRKWKIEQAKAKKAAETPRGGAGGATGGFNPGGGTTPGGTTGGGGRRSGGGGGGGNRPAPPDTGRPTNPPGTGFTGGSQANPGGNPMMPPAQGDDPTMAPLPTARFNPASQPDIFVWAHDDTVKAGATYRYELEYSIYNPIWHNTNVSKPQSLADQFAIPSPEGETTEPISVEADTNFYAVSHSASGIKFDIFRWKNGGWQSQTVTAFPGDTVGTVDPAGAHTDFSTGWTLLDVRDDPNQATGNKIVLLVGDTGAVLRKEINLDTKNAEYLKLRDLIAAQNAKNAPAPNGGNPTPPPGGGFGRTRQAQ